MPGKIQEAREQAVQRHDLDSGIFQGRYRDFSQGRFTDEFIYGRYQVFEEVDSILHTLPKNSLVLDLGCGTGHFANYILRQGFQVHAIDPSANMLRLARDNFPEIHFKEGIAQDLNFPDQFFDLVISIEVLRYLDEADVRKSYEEIFRVLKPGGKMLVTHVNKFALDGYYFFYHAKQFWMKLVNGTRHACYFTTPVKEQRLVREAGFTEIQITGRMYASIRIAFKFGKRFGRAYARFLERINSEQKFPADRAFMAGHLVVKATRPA